MSAKYSGGPINDKYSGKSESFSGISAVYNTGIDLNRLYGFKQIIA